MNPFVEWVPMTGWVRCYEGNGARNLSVAVNPLPNGAGGEWRVMAIEYPRGGKTAADFFADHAHQFLGDRKSETAARRLAERYAARWLERSTKLAPCACDEIGAASA